jgi:hypothetical protein
MIKREAKLSDTIIRLNMAIVERDTELSKAQADADRRGELLDRLFAAVVYGMSASLIPSDAIG